MRLGDMTTQDSVRSGLSRDDSTMVLWKRNAKRPSLANGYMGSDRSMLSSTPSQVSLKISDDSTPYEKQSSRRLIQSQQTNIFDGAEVMASYASVPLLEIDHLPRGGISFDTEAVGRIQFGIPPETIKDSMVLGLGVPSVYIVPVERFCREMGQALGINLCEFEFPAYFNYFVRVKQCTLVVDSQEDEQNIRRVFSETLLGPGVFRDHSNPTPNMEEDFDPSYPKDERPNFYKEFYHFRTAEESNNFQEMTIDTLIKFCHFNSSGLTSGPGKRNRQALKKLGVPPLNYGNGPINDFYHSVGEIGLPKKVPARGLRKSPVVHEEKVEEDYDKVDDESEKGLRRAASDPDLESLLRPSKNYDAMMGKEVSEPRLGRDNQKSSRRFNSIETCDNDSKLGDGFWGSAASVADSDDGKKDDWTYSQAKWLGVVATVYPANATEADKKTTMTARVEIFKMPGGLEYIAHDINDRNEIIGRVRFSGTVHVPDSIAVNGFTTSASEQDSNSHTNEKDEIATIISVPRNVAPPTFHPPSFGVTVLGNSHGFDKSGSTSGYVLWINGRGVMIDPPPYSSATLEKEGIRPQMIMAILVTHCHADHDAGAFQKVMTGSRVAVITTPTIYNSFIRKYAALSGLSEALLRHSHRHRPAIIGQPLIFQGASFHFTYTLHTIPCIAFRVEWRGRSIVFTGDHLNSPPMIDRLEKEGVLSNARAEALRKMPLQKCDLLLHESGAPPIHTPLKVLLELPENVKKRLYVVHTSALPEGCPLRVAPTGTAGTIRLDREDYSTLPPSVGHTQTIDEEKPDDGMDPRPHLNSFRQNSSGAFSTSTTSLRSIRGIRNPFKMSSESETLSKSIQKIAKRLGPRQPQDTNHSGAGRNSPSSSSDPELCEEEEEINNGEHGDGSRGKVDTYGWTKRRLSGRNFRTSEGSTCTYAEKSPPLVQLRPTCVSDAWFILNLLSNVPFVSSLSYDKTMEVLETAIVKVFGADQVIIPADRRSDLLCVVWEGTCMEKQRSEQYSNIDNSNSGSQTNRTSFCSEILQQSYTSFISNSDDDDSVSSHDVPFAVWHAGDWTGPLALQPDPSLSGDPLISSQVAKRDVVAVSPQGVKVILVYMKDLHEILKFSPLYRKFLNNRELEMKEHKATSNDYINDNDLFTKKVTYGMAKHVKFSKSIPVNQKKLLANFNFLQVINFNSSFRSLSASQKRHLESLVEGPRYIEPDGTIWQQGSTVEGAYMIVGGTAKFALMKHSVRYSRRGSTGSMDQAVTTTPKPTSHEVNKVDEPGDKLLFNVHPKSEYRRLEVALQLRAEEVEAGSFDYTKEILPKEEQKRDSRDRFMNKVLARLYARRAFTAGLVFSRGNFLCDTTRMVSGSLAFIEGKDLNNSAATENHVHSSSIIAGQEGCLVMEFPRSKFISFLDAYPGVLLSLLGTQVVA